MQQAKWVSPISASHRASLIRKRNKHWRLTGIFVSQRQQTLWLNAWYGKRKWIFLLLPLMWLFRMLSGMRRFYLQRFKQQHVSIPVVVVGNISVGGTGKTPLLIALVKHLQSKGFTPGVISRGYGGEATHYPLLLDPTTRVHESGDEPLSIYQQTGCAVCVDVDRVAAARALEQLGCDILLSDDGLQHYRLGRSLEIVVIDGQRGLGNGFCLPVGPLREPPSRLTGVDMVVINSATQHLDLPVDQHFSMAIVPQAWYDVKYQHPFALHHLPASTRVNAVAGIGNPQRFYSTLTDLGLVPVEHDFPDHHNYQEADFNFADSLPVVMTAKDAVKCQEFARDDWYYLAVGAQLPECFWEMVDARIASLKP
jgi:tetraacyldisaccharide 4'-kinase